MFYDLRHQSIYSTMVEMYDAREGIDVVTLQQKLKDKRLLDQVGGIAYLAQLPNLAASPAMVTYYTDIIHEKYLLRRMIQTCTGIVSRIYDYEGEVDALIDEMERDVLRVAEARASVGETDPVGKLVQRTIAVIEDCHQNRGKLRGIPTGFVDLDRLIWGMQPASMIVIAGRPSMGKSSLAANIADYVAVEQRLPVGVFTLETTADNLMMRMVCSRARVNIRNVHQGLIAERDFSSITDAAGRLSRAPLFVHDKSGLSVLQLRAKARRWHQQHGIKLLVIDYLQLLHSTSARAKTREQEIADISSGVKAIGKELNIPIIVLSQLNRELDREKNRKPRMADLRESGAVEQDADVVGLLYRPKEQDDDAADNGNDYTQRVNLLIDKQKDGPTGEVPLVFCKSYTRFESAAKISDDDVQVDTQPDLAYQPQ